ncbi:MAG: flagellar biosynthetic protein FliQ [Bauldia sp.]
MESQDVLEFARDSIFTLVAIATPAMLVSLVVGVVVALVQALTQIQEATLVFVPKIIAIFITILVGLPFIGATLGAYMTRVAQHITASG